MTESSRAKVPAPNQNATSSKRSSRQPVLRSVWCTACFGLRLIVSSNGNLLPLLPLPLPPPAPAPAAGPARRAPDDIDAEASFESIAGPEAVAVVAAAAAAGVDDEEEVDEDADTGVEDIWNA